jgi:eukaryotic-like serine/threonine-protein kinase
MHDSSAAAKTELSLTGLELQVGKYEIQTALGKGATGTVYLAKDTFTGRIVALKTIEPEVFRDPEFGTVHRTQFLAEASLAGKLKHPHIVGILDAVVQEDSGYIAMELVTGGDLSQFTEAGRLLPLADVLQIGFKCCGALDYAYREGIVHRDLKPANIMVVRGAEVKIADFGAALLRKTQALQTASMGSPSYMSPEQIGNRPLTFHSDMYSLGVVLYELLTGRKPFVADSLNMLIEKILHQDPPMPSTLRNGVPRSVDAIVLRAMGKKPEHRYKTWAEFALELFDAVKLVLPAEAVADSEKYVALKRVEMLIGLSDAELWEMASAARWMRVLAKKVLVRENEEGHSFFFLARGQVKVTRQGRLLNMVDEREFFGEMAYLWGGKAPRSATIEAATDLLVAEFEPEAVARMSEGAQLHLMRALARNLADRLDLANTRLGR